MAEGFPRKFGKYYLLAPLAQGGMGALYLAIAGGRGLEKLCVVKTVIPHLADAEYVARFRDEAKVVVKLSHGNLVPVFDAGQVDGEIFLAMDFVEGKDLRAVWNRCAHKGVAFPMDVAVYIVKELCRGLAYAHSFQDLRLVHRDVSPPNVLVSFSGEVKLTDFGLASSTLKLEKTAPGVIYGKVSYMSPEQARGEPLDGRTDLYAAGIILWELLTGRQLYPPGTAQPQDLLARAKNPRPDPPSRRATRVPPALDAIVLKALAAEPGQRYQVGEEMRAALAGWLAAEAPATDSARVEQFVSGLFADDLVRERAERDAMVELARERLRTVPPGSARGGELAQAAQAAAAGASPTAAGVGIGDPRGRRGIAVAVPAPGPGGATVLPTGAHGAAAGAVIMPDADLDDDEDPAHMDTARVLGQVIDGRYLVRGLIGEGGMGRVYEAEHVDIGKRFALKILHPVYSRMPEVVERFRREARAASRIGHPNIVDVTDSGTTADGSVYFVMEYLEGVELATVIDREGALDVARALDIAAQICRAVAAAHNAGIIHRDLKPENVFLVVRQGTPDFVKVLDFGIAKSAELEESRKQRLTHPGMAMGTPEYMAPEQAAGKPADARSDVYATGAILYEMLTGFPPYDGENFMEILTKKATIEPEPPTVLRPEIPEAVEVVVMRSLARSPADRPQSMEGFEYEITKCLAGRSVAVAKRLGMAVDGGALLRDGAPLAMAGASESLRIAAAVGLGDAGGSSPPAARASQGLPALAPGGTPPVPPALTSPLPAASLGAEGALAPPPTPPTVPDWAQEVPDPASVRGRRGGALFWSLLFLAALGAGAALYASQLDDSDGSEAKPTDAVTGRTQIGAKVSPGDKAGGTGKDRPKRPDADRPVPDRPNGTGKGPDRPGDKDPRGPTGASGPAVKPGDKPGDRPGDKPGGERPVRPAEVNTAPPRDLAEAGALLEQGLAALNAGKHAQARALYDRVSRFKPARADGLMGLSRVAFQTKEPELALRLAREALDAGGGDRARLLVGHAYFKLEKWTNAIEQYRDVLKRHRKAGDPLHREAKKALLEAEQKRRGRG